MVALVGGIIMADRDTKDDVFEYMLGKAASSAQNGQLWTSRHIIIFMVALTTPTPEGTICDPT